MEFPIQRLPPMVGPRPAAQIPRLGDRARDGRKPSDESLDAEDGESQESEEPVDEVEIADASSAKAKSGDAKEEPGTGETGEPPGTPRIDLMA